MNRALPEGPPDARPVPLLALGLSVASLSIPILAAGFAAQWLERDGAILIWLPVLVPAFLLTYYRGWRGASEALAAGMAVLALGQAEILALDLATPDWGLVFVMVVALVAVALGTGWASERLHQGREAEERSALTDPMTGLPNRRHASLFIESAWASTRRGHGLAVILFDVDRLKEVNDRHGRGEGDRVLTAFADLLVGRTRRTDVSARFGGGRFLSVLLDCPIDQAEVFARQVGGLLHSTDFGWGRVTVSAGVSASEAGMGSPDVLIAAADQALHAAKAGGSDNVCRADRPPSPSAQRAWTDAVPTTPRRIEDLKVLVVDDDQDTLRATTRLLERLGCDATSVGSARAGLDILKGEKPIDLLVTDIVMPEMSGFTLVDLAGEVRPPLPVLYMSGHPQEEVYWGGTPGARSAFLAKPMELDELRRALESVLPRQGSAAAASMGAGPSPERAEAPAGRAAPGLARVREKGPNGHAAAPNVLEGHLLVIDDDEQVVSTLQSLFRRAGYETPRGLSDPRQVGDLLRRERVDLIILDLHMPRMDGFQVLEEIRTLLDPEEYLPVLVLTGDDDPDLRRRALAAGAMDFLAKPFDPAEAEARVRNLLAARFLTQSVARQRDELEERVNERTSQLADTRTEILHRLALAAEYRDDVTGRHAERVGLLASLLAAELGMSAMEVDLVRRTGPLHDIGKIGVPDAVLRKPSRLTRSEFELMKVHTTIGGEILGGSRHRILQVAHHIAESHHERWDGTGYPHGLAGEQVPIEARLVSVSDAFDALTHDRPYRAAVSAESALSEIVHCRGTYFDPDVVDAFRSIYESVGPDRLPALVDPIDPLRDTTRAERSASETV